MFLQNERLLFLNLTFVRNEIAFERHVLKEKGRCRYTKYLNEFL